RSTFGICSERLILKFRGDLVRRVYMYERIRIPTKAIPTPTIRDKEMGDDANFLAESAGRINAVVGSSFSAYDLDRFVVYRGSEYYDRSIIKVTAYSSHYYTDGIGGSSKQAVSIVSHRERNRNLNREQEEARSARKRVTMASRNEKEEKERRRRRSTLEK
ncbi:hypothetical protein ALC62_07263, partial [Cyphomyrmex costatus]